MCCLNHDRSFILLGNGGGKLDLKRGDFMGKLTSDSWGVEGLSDLASDFHLGVYE